MYRSKKFRGMLFGVFIALLVMTSTVFADTAPWPTAGQNPFNTRSQPAENKLSPANASSLGVKWQIATAGDVTATPAMDDTNLYFPEWAGNLNAVSRATGATVWSIKISTYTGVANDVSRATPAIAGDVLILGDQSGRSFVPASIIAVNKTNGALIWKTQADSHPESIVTQSAVVNGNDVYVGVSSFEELLSAFTDTCCTFRGSIMDLSLKTGQIVWKTYMVPTGYSGGAVWGSTPVVDTARNSLYIGTGNNYSIPASVQTCLTGGTDPRICISPDDHFDSIMSLDLTTRAIKWATAALPVDAWNTNCLAQSDIPIPGFNPEPSLCPATSSPDYDFGQGPALITVQPASGKSYQLVGEGQKSGQYWALNPDTGVVAWVTQVGPGGTSGGLQWGSATDGTRIYVADSASLPTAGTSSGGSWSALDPATGAVLWKTMTPDAAGGVKDGAWGAVSTANGVVFGCSGSGILYALNGVTGAIVWSYNTGARCQSGFSIANATVFGGTGYSQAPAQYQTAGNFFAFGLP